MSDSNRSSPESASMNSISELPSVRSVTLQNAIQLLEPNKPPSAVNSSSFKHDDSIASTHNKSAEFQLFLSLRDTPTTNGKARANLEEIESLQANVGRNRRTNKSGYLKLGDIVLIGLREFFSDDESVYKGFLSSDGVTNPSVYVIPRDSEIERGASSILRSCMFKIENARLSSRNSKDSKSDLAYNLGKLVTFGEHVMFRHIHSNGLLRMNDKGLASENGCLQLHIGTGNTDESAWFTVEHIDITKQPGDPIKYSDTVYIKSMYRGSSYFIHFLQKIRTLDDKLECNLYGVPNQIHLRCYMSYQDLSDDLTVLYTNNAFRIYHKISNSYLTLSQNSILNAKASPELFLEVDQKNNANNLWELQKEATFVGGVTEVEGYYRIMHVVTGYYLRENMSKSGSYMITITSDSKAEGTLFKFYIDPDTPYEKITYKMLYRIETKSGNYLEIEDPKESYIDMLTDSQLDRPKKLKVQKTSNPLLGLSFCIKDAHAKKVNHVYQICNSIPNFLDFVEYLNYISYECIDFNSDERLSRQMIEECNIFMKVLDNFLNQILLRGHNEVSKDRSQCSIRETGLLESLMDISMLISSLVFTAIPAQFNSSSPVWKTLNVSEENLSEATKKLTVIRDKIYVLIYHIIRGNMKNNAVMAEHREYLFHQLKYHTESVGKIIRELYNYFATEQSGKSKEMINKLWDDLEPISEYNQNIYRQTNYIQIVSTLCEFEEKANGCNQRYILDELSSPDRDFHILRFDMINSRPTIEFHLPRKVTMKEFLDRNPKLKSLEIVMDHELLLEDEKPMFYIEDLSKHSEIVRYLDWVIELFCEICREREQKGIKFVREVLNADPHHIISVINNSNIDTKLRSRYAKLLRVAYVDVAPYLSQACRPYNIYTWSTDSISEITFPTISPNYNYDIIQLIYKFWDAEGMIPIYTDSRLVENIHLTTRFLKLAYDVIDLKIDNGRLMSIMLEPICIIIMNKIDFSKHWCRELMSNLSRNKMTKDAHLYVNIESYMIHSALSLLQIILNFKKRNVIKELLELFKSQYIYDEMHYGESINIGQQIIDIVNRLNFKIEYCSTTNQSLKFAFNIAKLNPQDTDDSTHYTSDNVKHSYELDIYLLQHLFNYEKNRDKRLKKKSLSLLIQNLNLHKTVKLEVKDVEFLTESISTNAFYRMVELRTELQSRMRTITLFQNEDDIIAQGVLEAIEAACNIVFEFTKLLSFDLKDRYKVSKYQNLARHAGIHHELIEVLYLSPDNKIYDRLFHFAIDAIYLFCFSKLKNQIILAEHKERLIELIGTCLGVTRILSMALSKSIKKKSDVYVNNVIKMIIDSIKLTNLKPELLQVLRTLLLDDQMRVVPKLQIAILKGLLHNKTIITLNSEEMISTVNFIKPILDIKDISIPDQNEKITSYLKSLKPDHLLNFHIELMKTINACAFQNRFSILQCRKLISRRNLFKRLLDDNEATKLNFMQKKVYLRFMYVVFMVEVDNIPPAFTINDLDEIFEKINYDILAAGSGLDYIIDLARKNLYENIKPIDSYHLTEESVKEMIRQKSTQQLGPLLVEGDGVVIYDDLEQDEKSVLDAFNYLSGEKSWHTEKDGLLHVLADIFNYNRYNISDTIKQKIMELMNCLDTFSSELRDIEDQNQDLDFSNLMLVVNSCREAIPITLHGTIENAEAIINSEKYQATTKVLVQLRDFIISEKLHIEESYKIFDIDRDGKVSLEEFKKAIRSILGNSILLHEIEEAFNELDEDDDEMIDFKEFRGLLRRYFVRETSPLKNAKGSALKFAGSEHINEYKDDELDEEQEIFKSLKNFGVALETHCQETDINILVEKVRKNIIDKDLESPDSSKLTKFISSLEKVFKKKENKVYVLKILNLIIPQVNSNGEFPSIYHDIPAEKFNSIRQIQNLYIKSGVHLTALDIIYQDTNKELLHEAFELLEALVRYGNVHAQSALLVELKNMSNTFIFSYIRNRIRSCRDRIVERVNRSFSKSKNMMTNIFNNTSDSFYDSRCFILSPKEKKKYEHVQTLLNFIIGCCENCNSSFQNYFREQVDDIKKNKLSINLVEELGMFLINIKELGRYLRNDDEALKIIPRCLLALVNLCRGPCVENQLILGMKRKLYQFLRLYMEMSKDDLDIRYCILFLESLIEGEIQNPIGEIMLEEIDFKSLSQLAVEVYNKYIHSNVRDVIQDKVQGRTTDSNLLIFMNLISGGMKFEHTGLRIEESSWIDLGFSIVLVIVKLKDAFPNNENLKYLKFSEAWGNEDTTVDVVKRISNLGGRQESLIPALAIFIQSTFKSLKARLTGVKEVSTMDNILEFYLSLICTVEIDRNGELVKHYFRAPRILAYSSPRINRELIQYLNRNSHEEKIKSFFYLSEKQQFFLEHLQFLSRFRILSWWAEKWNNLANINYFLVVLANFIILFSTEDQSESYIEINGTNLTGVLIAIGILIVILSIVIYIFYILENYRIIIYDKVTKGNKARSISWEMLKGLQGTMLLKTYKEMIESNTSLNEVSMYLQLPYIILDSYNIYNLLYVAISLIALNQPYVYCILLLDILRRNETLRDILKAITLNWKALVLTGILATVIIFGLGIIAFLYLGEYYATQEEGADMNTYCYSLWECFSSSFSNGLRAGGGIGDVLLGPLRDENDYGLRQAFDLVFFMVIIIVLLNIIFGIIIDNFASLRDIRKEILQDMETVCMICGREKHEFESRGSGWLEHISIDHNMWSFMGFIFYIRKKPTHLCNGLEKYVKQKLRQQDVSFFPKTTKSIEMFDEDDEDTEAKQLEETVKSLCKAFSDYQVRLQSKTS